MASSDESGEYNMRLTRHVSEFSSTCSRHGCAVSDPPEANWACPRVDFATCLSQCKVRAGEVCCERLFALFYLSAYVTTPALAPISRRNDTRWDGICCVRREFHRRLLDDHQRGRAVTEKMLYPLGVRCITEVNKFRSLRRHPSEISKKRLDP